MKEEIATWKKENGNSISYSTKELIEALHVKVDKIDHKLNCGEKKIAVNRANIIGIKWAVSGMAAGAIAAIGWLVRLK